MGATPSSAQTTTSTAQPQRIPPGLVLAPQTGPLAQRQFQSAPGLLTVEEIRYQLPRSEQISTRQQYETALAQQRLPLEQQKLQFQGVRLYEIGADLLPNQQEQRDAAQLEGKRFFASVVDPSHYQWEEILPSGQLKPFGPVTSSNSPLQVADLGVHVAQHAHYPSEASVYKTLHAPQAIDFVRWNQIVDLPKYSYTVIVPQAYY